MTADQAPVPAEAAEEAGQDQGEEDAALPVLEPRLGIPPVTDTPEALARALEALSAAEGPVAVDAERASGYRYGQRAYLLQFNRQGAGTWLIDPIALPDLSGLQAALGTEEWVLHAASQDLPCLRELGLRPGSLFDTEVAGRLLGRERVGLGPLVESELHVRLEKGHGSADWSTRPLPQAWLRYAALDVEVLLDLRDRLAGDLSADGKETWAREEFAALLAAPPAPPRTDPWRRTSGIHAVRGRRGLAAVRELWTERDALAQQRDTSPGRVLPDAAIVAAARALPTSREALEALPEFQRPAARRAMSRWWAALQRAEAIPDSDLPPMTLPGDGPPPPRLWADRDPDAAARLAAARGYLAALSEQVGTPVENLAPPDAVRRVLWQPPADASPRGVEAALRDLGARKWQAALICDGLAEALLQRAPDSASSDAPTDP